MPKPKHVGTWVLAVLDGGEITKWGKDGDTEFPYPPKSGEALAQAKYLAALPEHSEDTFYMLNVFDNGQMKQFEFDPAEHGVKRTPKAKDPRPEFPEDAPYNRYDVEALEKFVVRTQYHGVKARSEDEAKWLVRNGEVGYDDKEIEEGDEEFLSVEDVTLTEEDVDGDEDDGDDE